MGKKTERLKSRLREAPGELHRDALTQILRMEEQINVLLEFGSYVNGWVGSMEKAEFVNASPELLAPLKARLASTRNDVKRLADPDDKGCCG